MGFLSSSEMELEPCLNPGNSWVSGYLPIILASEGESHSGETEAISSNPLYIGNSPLYLSPLADGQEGLARSLLS